MGIRIAPLLWKFILLQKPKLQEKGRMKINLLFLLKTRLLGLLLTTFSKGVSHSIHLNRFSNLFCNLQ